MRKKSHGEGQEEFLGPGRRMNCPVCGVQLDAFAADFHVNACLDGVSENRQRDNGGTVIRQQASVTAFFKSKLTIKAPKIPLPNPLNESECFVKIPQLRARNPFPHLYEHKWVMGTDILVDAFKLGPHPDCRAYFLTHFHSDHYDGLNGKWSHVGRPIYSSVVTKSLVEARLGLKKGAVTGLPVNIWIDIYGGIRVALIDAHQ